jgi:hypothetical protein
MISIKAVLSYYFVGFVAISWNMGAYGVTAYSRKPGLLLLIHL